MWRYVVLGRSYGASPDGQAHENPEWEKARQALASITKSQGSNKAPPANRTPAEVKCDDVLILCWLIMQDIFKSLDNGIWMFPVNWYGVKFSRVIRLHTSIFFQSYCLYCKLWLSQIGNGCILCAFQAGQFQPSAPDSSAIQQQQQYFPWYQQNQQQQYPAGYTYPYNYSYPMSPVSIDLSGDYFVLEISSQDSNILFPKETKVFFVLPYVH